MSTVFRSFINDESGGAAVEYGLVAAVFAVALIGAMQAVGSNASIQLASTQTGLQNNAVSPP